MLSPKFFSARRRPPRKSPPLLSGTDFLRGIAEDYDRRLLERWRRDQHRYAAWVQHRQSLCERAQALRDHRRTAWLVCRADGTSSSSRRDDRSGYNDRAGSKQRAPPEPSPCSGIDGRVAGSNASTPSLLEVAEESSARSSPWIEQAREFLIAIIGEFASSRAAERATAAARRFDSLQGGGTSNHRTCIWAIAESHSEGRRAQGQPRPHREWKDRGSSRSAARTRSSQSAPT